MIAYLKNVTDTNNVYPTLTPRISETKIILTYMT